jgi:hypothetical protein
MSLLGKLNPREVGPVEPDKEIAPSVHEIAPVLAPEKVSSTIEQSSELTEQTEPAVSSEQISEAAPPQTTAAPIIKDEVVKGIEDILSEDLTDLFLKMSPEQQQEFRDEGEATASKIRVLLSETKIKIKNILVLITQWLRMIPGINQFFLEQEAKIKTDKILLEAENFRQEGKL